MYQAQSQSSHVFARPNFAWPRSYELPVQQSVQPPPFRTGSLSRCLWIESEGCTTPAGSPEVFDCPKLEINKSYDCRPTCAYDPKLIFDHPPLLLFSEAYTTSFDHHLPCAAAPPCRQATGRPVSPGAPPLAAGPQPHLWPHGRRPPVTTSDSRPVTGPASVGVFAPGEKWSKYGCGSKIGLPKNGLALQMEAWTIQRGALVV